MYISEFILNKQILFGVQFHSEGLKLSVIDFEAKLD